MTLRGTKKKKKNIASENKSITSRGYSSMLLLQGLFGGSLQITSEIESFLGHKKEPQKILRALLVSKSSDSLRLDGLRGPVAILFISRDTCSDSIAKIFRACFCGVSHKYRAICCKMGYRTDVPL